MFPTGMFVSLPYTAGFALVGLIAFYLISKIIMILKIDNPWNLLILFPFAVALLLYLMLLFSNMLYGSYNDLKPHFLVAIIGFPLGWFTGLVMLYFIKTLKGKHQSRENNLPRCTTLGIRQKDK
ncbi:MAG: hypothetical protein Q7I94_03610 [Candidatus Contubernalis sp.]|nr:hypothetical protein [Candidatus Contubernalis sp.]